MKAEVEVVASDRKKRKERETEENSGGDLNSWRKFQKELDVGIEFYTSRREPVFLIETVVYAINCFAQPPRGMHHSYTAPH